MHANVDISRELQETRNLCDAVLLTQDQGGSGGDGKFDASLENIALGILGKVGNHWSINRHFLPSCPLLAIANEFVWSPL